MSTRPESSVLTAALQKREAAAYLAVSEVTLYRLTRAGKIPHVRIGRAIRWRVEDLDAFLSARVTTSWEDFRDEKGKE